jgi:hypothetical protein
MAVPFERFESASDFMRALQPKKPPLEPSAPAFVYRGQGDAAWPLRPSALRKCHQPLRSPYVYEYSLLDNFLQGCDAAGLLLPEDTREFRERIDLGTIADAIRVDGWPPEWLWPLCALAQHHKIPTRLLDWSRSFVVGAFFAARQAVHSMPCKNAETPESTDLAVWVIDLTQQNIFLKDQIRFSERLPCPSPNLAAQAGVFTVHGLFNARAPSDELDVAFAQRRDLEVEVGKLEYLGIKPLKQYLLPKSKAVDLLFHCDMLGVNAATMFPGYDGAALRALDLGRAWDLREQQRG